MGRVHGGYFRSLGAQTEDQCARDAISILVARWKVDLLSGLRRNAHQIYRCPAGGGDATLLLGSMDSTTATESFDGTILYFANGSGDAALVMLKQDRAEATPQKVPLMPTMSDRAKWAAVADGIYFSPQENARSVKF